MKRAEKNSIVLHQPTMRKLLIEAQAQLTRRAETAVVEIHKALGGRTDEDGERSVTLSVPRGEVGEWRSFEDAVTYDNVTSREEYLSLWKSLFPEDLEYYTVTTSVKKGSVSLIIESGQSCAMFSIRQGEYIIPQVPIILECILSAIQED